MDRQQLRRQLIAYSVMSLLTLMFQLYIRSSQCVTDCPPSYAKAVIWAMIWPLSWLVYLAGLLTS
jgi:hypothetical protein